MTADTHRPRIDKRGISRDTIHPDAGEAFDTVVRFNGRDHRLDAVHDGLEIDLGRRRGQPILVGRADRFRYARALDQRLGRNAAIVKTIAAHFAIFDQRHLGADGCGDIA